MAAYFSVFLQLHSFADGVVLIAVGTGKVEANHLALHHSNLRNGGKAHDEAGGKTEMESLIVVHCRKVDGILLSVIVKNELLVFCRNGTELSHAVASSVKHVCLLYVFHYEVRIDVGKSAVGLGATLQERHQAEEAACGKQVSGMANEAFALTRKPMSFLVVRWIPHVRCVRSSIRVICR